MAEAAIIGTGRRYRDSKLRLWGHQSRTWVVESVFIGADGLEHVRLCCLDEPSLYKTLSTAALKDKRQFEPAEGTG
ncbi:MAG TPA: hypothetical protein VEI03_03070 [Stellaceae bacterium]|nr:hypothetical protein [Stellaceae bacterium]